MNRKIVGIGLILACIITFGSCKPKQSAYKSVYEAAKEREMEENANAATTTPTTTTRPSTSYTSSSDAVKKEKVTPVYESDASGLKAYNVVIAAMSMKPNAESLKKRIEAEGYNVILVQNEQGMYRVIIASYDSKEQAVARKNEILSAFSEMGDADTLRQKFGIPFNDWWILQREY